MSDIRFEGWLHRSGTGGVYQDSAGNVGIASTQPQQKLDIGNGGFQVGPTGIATVTTVNTTNLINATQLSHRNIVINGAMMVAQRGTSSTVADGFGALDRFRSNNAGNDEVPTQSQVDVASGTTPYTSGFRKAFRMTNGNQTGGASADARSCILYNIEAQDIVNSGWNYTSATNYITIQFWVKASVAQNYYVLLRTRDGTEQGYTFETGSLTADTWTKITKTIPGNSNITFNNDTGIGLALEWNIFRGTNKTGSMTLNQWAAFNSAVRVPDMTSTWYTTNDATFEITGVQLEVGSVATPFEHRSFGDEMARCKRYYNKVFDAEGQSGEKPASLAVYETSSAVTTIFNFPKMRNVPTLDITNGTNKFMVRSNSVSDHFDTLTLRYGTSQSAEITQSSGVSGTAGYGGYLRGADTDVYIAFSAEL